MIGYSMDALTLNETVNKALDVADEQLNLSKEALGIKPDLAKACKHMKMAAIVYVEIMNFVLETEYYEDIKVKLDDETFERCSRYVTELTRIADETKQLVETISTKKFGSDLN